MGELKYVFLLIGTGAFFVDLFLARRSPELVDGPMGAEKPESEDHPLKKWDRLAYWVMWAGWALAALMMYLEKAKLIEVE